MNFYKFFIIFFAISFLSLSNISLAVSSDSLNSVTITLNPSYPKPGQVVTASVDSKSLDLERADITWLVNGSIIKQGIGQKSVDFSLGKSGTMTNIEVRVENKTAGLLTDSLSITPATVDLIWESGSYTPLLYKGKPLHSSESFLRILAVPQISVGGKKIRASELVYEWKVNGTPQQDQSGYGRYSFTYMGPKTYGEDTISLVVSTKDNLTFASNQIKVETIDPEIIFYQENDLYGTNYSRPVSRNFFMDKAEYTVRAEPFYFSEENLFPTETSFKWYINGEEVEANSNKRLLRIRRAKESGTAVVGIFVTNTIKLLQEAQNSFNVYF